MTYPPPPMGAPAAIGRIEPDTLRYHGSYPLSDWGSIWKRVFSHVPIDAAYGIYEHYIRKTGVLPVPPLQFVAGWENKCFRIVKTEDGGERVIALYKHDGDFFLIGATLAAYERWAEKRDAALLPKPVRPLFSHED